MKNANTLLFRASSMGDIMTGVAKKWTVEESLTCQRKLVQMYREILWKRKADSGNKYTKKGTAVEEDGLTLLSTIKKTYFVKNDKYLYNEYFKGEVDTFLGESVETTKHTYDTKCSWDWLTFPSLLDSKPDAAYDYQGQVYMDLTGAQQHTLAYCLVNTPGFLINAEKRRLAFSMGITDDANPEYVSQCIEIEKNCIVDMELFKKHNPEFVFHCDAWDFDIPADKRLFEIHIKRDDAKIEAMKNRVAECRLWMNNNLFI